MIKKRKESKSKEARCKVIFISLPRRPTGAGALAPIDHRRCSFLTQWKMTTSSPNPIFEIHPLVHNYISIKSTLNCTARLSLSIETKRKVVAQRLHDRAEFERKHPPNAHDMYPHHALIKLYCTLYRSALTVVKRGLYATLQFELNAL